MWPIGNLSRGHFKIDIFEILAQETSLYKLCELRHFSNWVLDQNLYFLEKTNKVDINRQNMLACNQHDTYNT